MEKIVLVGKGGIGKTTVAVGLSLLYAKEGRRVLHVGCDPKHDSSVLLQDGAVLTTVMEQYRLSGYRDLTPPHVIMKGRRGIDCVESGGPEPGVGCGGRGVGLALDLISKMGLLNGERYDRIIFDVLGDVVCGGFAAPLRKGFGQKVYAVTSEELMSLYAANNVAKAVRLNHAHGIILDGLIVNLRGSGADLARIERFASRLSTRIVGVLPRDPTVGEAEFKGLSVVDHSPTCPFVHALAELADRLTAPGDGEITCPTPLTDFEFYRSARVGFERGE